MIRSFIVFIFLSVLCVFYVDARVFEKVSREDIKMFEESVMSSESKEMKGVLSLFISDLRSSKIPNYFELSDLIIRMTEESDKDKQLMAARAAVEISPVYPDAHLALFTRTLRYQSYDFGVLFPSFFNYIKSLFDYLIYDALFLSIIAYVHLSAFVFLLFFTIVLLIKYKSLVIHTLMHVTDFSRFYTFIFVFLFAAFVFLLLLSGSEPAFVFIPTAFFLFPFMKTFENITFILFIIIASITGIFLFSFEFSEKQDLSSRKLTSMINSIYSPLSEKDNSSLGHHHLRDFVLGAEAFYEKKYEIALKHLSMASQKIKDKEILASIENMRGAAFFMNGNYDRAEKHFRRAFKISRSPLTGFNLMRLLNEKGDFEEAGMLEKQLDFSGVSTDTGFPAVYLPSLRKFFSFVFSNKNSGVFFVRKELILTFLMILVVFAFIFVIVLRKINMKICEECGNIMCIDCSVSYEGTICSACKIRKKASSLLIPEKEKNLHKIKVRRFYSVKRIYTMFFALLFPGGGMIFGGRETGGIIYAIASVFTAVPFLAENTGFFSFCTPFAGTSLFFILVVVAALLYVFSILSTVSLIQE